MGLSKRYLDTKTEPTPVDIDALGVAIRDALPEVVFAYLHGSSAAEGVVAAHSDLDVALYLDPGALRDDRVGTLGRVGARVEAIAADHVPGVRCDLGILNGADPVFRFEVLKGRLLFTRDQESWLRFYSLACREYESQMVSYERQRRYRLEARR